MKRFLFLLLLFLAAIPLYGQTQIQSGPTDPATCDPTLGQLWFNNSTVPPVLKYCSAINTWTAVGTATGSTLFPWTTLSSSATPTLNVSNGSVNYFMSVTSNVTAVTTSGSAPNGTYLGINFQEDGTGGHTIPTAAFPGNFIFPPGCVFTITANANNWLAWTFDGTNWQPVPGGGGSCGNVVLQTNAVNNGLQTKLNLQQGTGVTLSDNGSGTVTVTAPGQPTTGATGTLQKTDGSGGHLATNCSESNTTLNCGDDPHFRGPNLGVDIVSAFNARVQNPNTIVNTTGTITGGTNALVVASAANWQTNDGFSLVGGGATNCATPPSAPTGFPALASAMTGTGYAVAGATGANSASYAVVAISQGGCYTAASPILTISNSFATLGANNMAITSCSNSLGTVTCTVTSTTNLATGAWVRIGETSTEFDGYFQITVLNSTQFTYATGISSQYWMSSNSSTGGNLYYWASNHITLPTLPAGTNIYKEAVYRCYGASCALPANAANYALAYVSYPLTLSNTASDPSFGVWDDYGTTMTPNYVTNLQAPWWLPLTPPSANVNDMLTTTVTNISGTNFTLAANATNSTSSAPMRFDIAPAWSAAQSAANSFNTGGGGTVHFPPAVENSGTGAYCYVLSSYFSLSGAATFGAPLCLGDTLNQGSGSLIGTYENSIRMQTPGHSAQPLLPINCHGANPCILRQSGLEKGFLLNIPGGNSIGVFDTSTLYTITSDVTFSSASASDLSGILYYYYNDASGTGQFGGHFTNTAWLSSLTQTVGSTSTPLFISKNGEFWTFDYYNNIGRGFYFDCNPANPSCAFFESFKQGALSQGLVTPTYVFNESINAAVGGNIYFEHVADDSYPEPMVVNASTVGSIAAPLTINGTNLPASGMPLVTGRPWNATITATIAGPNLNNQIGTNHNLNLCSQSQKSGTSYTGCTLPALNLATATYTANHTLTASEGIVKTATSGITFTLPHAIPGQTWEIYNQSAGTITLTIDSGTLSGGGATGPITIPANQGAWAACDGTNCNALVSGAGGGGGSPGGSTDALQYNGGGGSFGGVNSPTANGNYLVNYNVSASAAVPPTINLPGVPINPQTGTTYTYLYSDRGSLVTASNAGAQTYTLVNPSSAGFGQNFFNVLHNINTGAVTENASGFTVNGGASLLVPPSWVRFLWSDGVNYRAARFADFGAFPNCVGGGNALQFTTSTGAFSCGSSSSGVSSWSGDGALYNNVTSTGAVTATLANAGAHKFWMNNTGSSAAPGYEAAGEADLPATTVFTDKANTMGAFLFDLSAGTTKIPTSAGCTASATSMICYDSTNKNWHIYDNNADAIGCAFSSAPTTGDLVSVTVASSQVLCSDSGTLAANVVTAASAASAAKQVCTSSGASKTCSYIDYPETFYVPAANCVNAQAASAWSTGATPASLCRAGTNNKDGLLSPWGASDVGYFKVHLPNDWDSGASLDISIDLTSTDATNGHTIIMQASTTCAKGDGSTTDDVAFNAAQSFGTITLNGNANRTWNATLTGLTKTGCIAGSTLWIKISRTTDTATNVGVYGATVDVARLITVQAN